MPPSGQIVSFGVFTADLRSAELYKNGVKVRLERQPFQVLSIMLEHPGELISREELRNRVWPQDTFVDFDHALNTAITKIRVAVGDSADSPRFVETVPRRGYRFVAPVNGAKARVLATAGEISPGVKSASAIPRTLVLAATGITLAVLGGLFTFWLRSPVPPPRVLKYIQLTSDGQYKEDLFTDGNRLYFTEAKSGRLTLAQMSTAGGPVTPFPLPFEQLGLSDISADGSSLLVHAYAADQDRDDSEATYVLSLSSGTPRRLGGGAFLDAVWSPNGRQIAYREGTDLCVAGSD